MKFVYQVILCVTVLASMNHFTQVQCELFNFGIVDKIKNSVNSLLQNLSHRQSVGSQNTSAENVSAVQPFTHSTSTYTPVVPEGVERQATLSTVPQYSGNGTVQGVPEERQLIQVPLRDGQCDSGYREVNGQCRKVYGRRRRRR
jgi:hypothetical protein